MTIRVDAARRASKSGSKCVELTMFCPSSASVRVPSSSVGIPNIAGSGPGWAANSAVIGPVWLTIAMKCAIPAPKPRCM